MKLINYPSYKIGKANHIKYLPEHWAELPLKRLFRLQKRKPKENDEIVTAFRDGTVTLRKNRREDGFTNALKEIGYQQIQRNDLVIHAMDAFAGAIGVSDSEGKSTPVYSVCTAINDADPQFYAYYLRDLALNGFIESLAKGIRERSTDFRWNDASILAVPIPTASEQKAIAQFLERETAKIDALIAEQEQLIELLQEKRQAVISHAVTKGLNPNAPMKDSGVEWLGEVPRHWRVSKLIHLSEAIGDGLHGTPTYSDDSEIHFINGTNLHEGKIRITDKTQKVQHFDWEQQKIRIDESTILLSINGTIGNYALHNGEVIMLGKSAAYINCSRALSREFLALLIQSSELQEYFQLSCTGTTIRNLSLNSIRKMPIPLPSTDEQIEIASYITQVSRDIVLLISASEDALKLYLERRSALISAAVTGQIDVRGLVTEVEAA